MDCAEFKERFDQTLQLPLDERAELIRHFMRCESCKEYMQGEFQACKGQLESHVLDELTDMMLDDLTNSGILVGVNTPEMRATIKREIIHNMEVEEGVDASTVIRNE